MDWVGDDFQFWIALEMTLFELDDPITIRFWTVFDALDGFEIDMFGLVYNPDDPVRTDFGSGWIWI